MTTAKGVTRRVDTAALEEKVKAMYRDVALDPRGEFHFEMGRALAERTGLPAASCDAVISNGVINLAPDKGAVFREAARLLKAGGRLALADIVAETQLAEGITCDATLWAACIGGAMQIGDYRSAMEAAGLRVKLVKENLQYRFISNSALGATKKYGVKSVSLVAIKG